MSFKTELHCHTNFSGCSNVPAEAVAEKYIAAGYNTIVITNHFTASYRGDKPHAQITRELFAAVEDVKTAAGEKLHVLPAMELTFRHMPNDFLVYGLTEEQIAGMEDMFDIRPGELHNRVAELGGIMIQAHPFRFGQMVVNPAEVDGIEVFNGHVGHYSHNEIAKMWAVLWAERYRRDGSFIMTSGTDHHYMEQQPVGGIETEEEITSTDELLAVLRSGNFRRITASLGDKDF